MITKTNAGSYKLRYKYNSVIPTSGVEAHTHIHYLPKSPSRPGTSSETITFRTLLDVMVTRVAPLIDTIE